MLTVIQDNESVDVAVYTAKKKTILKRIQKQYNEEWDIVGSLSVTTKMPGYSIGLPASACITGSKLQEVEGSVCNGCYALRGHYSYDVVQNALYRRLYSLNHPLWVPAMATLITQSCAAIGENYFRFHDSGDLMGVWHLKNIVEVVKLTPHIQYWIPSREFKIVKDYHKQYGPFPDNLIVRLSAHMIDGPAPKDFTHTSTVSRKNNATSSVSCEAYTRNNNCGPCRACWQKDVKDVSYPKH